MIDNKTTYAYDALKRLTNVTFDSPTPETPGAAGVKSRSITLDKLDNILKITDNESGMLTEIVGELEGQGRLLSQYSRFNGLPLEHDRNGNLSAKGSRLFAYDYKNRLIRSSKGDDAVTFTYDIFGRQTSRTDVSGTCHYFYAGDQKIEERNSAGQVTKHYFWGNGIDELLRLDIYNGNVAKPYYVHSDSIGSTTTVTDENGNVVERVRYDAYGVPSFTDALGQSLKKSTIGNTTLFQGREYDYDLALYNYRARYFDPSMGRFLQTDPLGYQDSMNLYQGMGMNPVNFVDPWGEATIVLDPGHGDIYNKWLDPGALGINGLPPHEKDLMLTIAKILKAKLERKGHTVYLTREYDLDDKKRERFEWRRDVAEEKEADIFISLHADSPPSGPQGNKLMVAYRTEEGKKLAESIKNSVFINSDVIYFPFNILFSTSFERGFGSKLVEEHKYAVISGKSPKSSVLIESGNMQNPFNCQLIVSKRYTDQLAEGINKHAKKIDDEKKRELIQKIFLYYLKRVGI